MVYYIALLKHNADEEPCQYISHSRKLTRGGLQIYRNALTQEVQKRITDPNADLVPVFHESRSSHIWYGEQGSYQRESKTQSFFKVDMISGYTEIGLEYKTYVRGSGTEPLMGSNKQEDNCMA